jgi:hypothetical protein
MKTSLAIVLAAAGLVLVAMTTDVIPGKGATSQETSAEREQKTTECTHQMPQYRPLNPAIKC